jgi:3-hydroxyacyl-CoA dehydrogenase/enoyl-CoA hydratase/3-hydroxybutyryl-CoA epimerase
MANNYRHWRSEADSENIHWLTLDKADAGTNVLSAEVLEEFAQLLDEMKQAPPRALVIQSGKTKGFIAGADVKEFTGFDGEQAAQYAVRRAHEIFDTVAALPFPTIALINGYCLGGGLELALACRYRIADDSASTKLGLPEVRLGIHPGFGGTLRSIQTVGAPAAMDLMLSGRTVSARAAKKIGLIHYAVPMRQLQRAARHTATKPPATKPLAFWKRWASYKRVRPLLGKYLIKKVEKRAPRAHYPAPYALIDLWVQYYDQPRRMLAEEANSVARLIVGRTAQNLIRVFLLRERLKSLGRSDDPRPTHIHVIGAGVMGGDIATWCALSGFRVSIQDQKLEALARMMKRAFQLYSKKIKDRRQVTNALDRLMPDPHGHGLGRADIVIEAIFEDAEVKRQLFKDIEPKLKDNAIIATNTSSIPLDELNRVLSRPGRLVGLHFFNPVAKMPLVEVVQSPNTDTEISRRAAAFTLQIDRLPLPVTSTPGFLVNRILMPYLIEAVVLAEEEVPLYHIDKAATDFGMPMGPIELADTVGLDICLHVATILSEHMSIEVPERLKSLVKRGHLGKKSGQGFYSFKNGKPVRPRPPKDYSPPADIQDRLILRMLNEAVACLREGVVTDGDLGDAGIIFGTGFAPFRGGPFHYIETRGVEQLTKMLEQLQQRLGPRFEADAGWKNIDSPN